jgi:hypothetical protein
MVLCHHFLIEQAVCLRVLHDRLGLQKSHLHWVACPVDQPEERRNVIFEAFLTALMEQKASSFGGIITGDESWFVLYYPVIRSGRRHVTSFLESSSRKVTRKNA